eukprot:5851860-Prymnesium_polylepis.1
MTKRAFMGLFALEPEEADAYPHGKRARYPSGFMFIYGHDASRSVLRSGHVCALRALRQAARPLHHIIR